LLVSLVLALDGSVGTPRRRLGIPPRLIGHVIECLVEAYVLMGACGRLTSARPDTDIDHKDFIFDERGGYQNVYLQVKGVSKVHRGGSVRMSVDYPKGKIMSDPSLFYAFCLLDVEALRITRLWLVPSVQFTRLATRGYARKGHVRLVFTAGKRGKWTKFEIEPRLLGARLVEVIDGRNHLSRSHGNRVHIAA
jgi:hypothetical protein